MRKYSRTAIAVLKKREVESWIYSYADLITNLLALFIMLLIVTTGFGNSKEKLKKGLEAYVNGTNKTGIVGHAGTGASNMDDLHQMIADYLNKIGLAGRISLERTKTGIELTFESAMLFASGTADIDDSGVEILNHVGTLLKGLPQKFVVDAEGYADNRPINSPRYPSNWELSSARAGAVVRLLEAQGIPGSRLRAIGFGSTRPLDGHGDSEINRRVLIRINAEEGGN